MLEELVLTWGPTFNLAGDIRFEAFETEYGSDIFRQGFQRPPLTGANLKKVIQSKPIHRATGTNGSRLQELLLLHDGFFDLFASMFERIEASGHWPKHFLLIPHFH